MGQPGGYGTFEFKSLPPPPPETGHYLLAPKGGSPLKGGHGRVLRGGGPKIARAPGGVIAPPAPSPQAPSPLATYAGQADSNVSVPPDTHGAVGPSHIMSVHNTRVRIQDRLGNQQSQQTLQAFWDASGVSPVCPGPSPCAFDPKVFYDEETSRWVFVSMTHAASANSAILVAVSANSDPTGVWYARAYDADAANFTWADYPTVGINTKWISVGASMFVSSMTSNAFNGTKIWVFEKSQLIAPGAVTPHMLNPFFDQTGDGLGFTLQAAITYDNSQADLFLLDSGWLETASGPSLVRISKITGPVATPSWEIVTTNDPAGQGYLQLAATFDYYPAAAQQLGSASKLDTGDARVLSSVFRNGHLWFSLTGGLPFGAPTRASAYWFELTPTVSPAVLVQGGVVDAVGKYYFFPSIAVDADDNAALGFTASDPSIFAGAYYTGRYNQDTLGTMQTPVQYKAGAAKYTKDFGSGIRWGDYSATVPDPVTANVFWTIQEYAEAVDSCGAGFDCWGTHWGKFSMIPFPAAPSGLTATTLGVSSLTFAWSAVSGASSYNISYATNPASLIAASASPSFIFTGLSPNFNTGVSVAAVNLQGQGSASVGPSTTTLAVAVTASTPTAHISSITAVFTACGAGLCSGYQLEASTAPDFTGIVFASATVKPAVTQLQASGLAASTTYYLRLAALNASGGPSYIAVNTMKTADILVTPGESAFSAFAETAIGFNWLPNGNPPAQTYTADVSTASDFTGTLQTQSGLELFSALFSGLSVNTSYYFRVKAVGGPTLSTGPVATLAQAPTAASPAFTGLSPTGLTLNWALGANPALTLFRAELSAAENFAGAVSSQTRNTFAAFTGLTGNTTYYTRILALNRGMTETAFTTMPATSTLALPPVFASFSGLSSATLSASFGDGGNPGGTLYLARISTASAFTGLQQAVITTLNAAAFVGLLSNQTYYFQAGALNNNGVPSAFSATAATATFAAPPALGAGFSGAAVGGLRASWAGGANGAASAFTVQTSSVADFSSGLQSSSTANSFADFTGLLANTTYHARVKTNSAAPPSPDSGFTSLGGASTLALAPTAAGVPLYFVAFTSAAAQWTPLASGPQSVTAEGYRLEASTASDFSGTLLSVSSAGPAASQLTLAGLSRATTYYFRVGSLSWDGGANYLVIGTTRTQVPVLSSSTVGSGTLTLAVVPAFSQIETINVTVPPGVFPAGTVIEMDSSIGDALPAALSNQGNAVSLGQGVGISLSAQGRQPNGHVTIQMKYAANVSSVGAVLQMFRYDDGARQWTLLDSAVDTKTRTLTARTNHFSFFAPFQVNAANDLDLVNIFPIPWEPGSSDARFNADAVRFANLPAGATVRLYTVNGELVWKASASASGTLSWTGENRYGRKAASGTYLVVIEAGGARRVKRVVVIR